MVNTKYAVEYQDEGFTFLAIAPGLVGTGPIEPREFEFFVDIPATRTLTLCLPSYQPRQVSDKSPTSC